MTETSVGRRVTESDVALLIGPMSATALLEAFTAEIAVFPKSSILSSHLGRIFSRTLSGFSGLKIPSFSRKLSISQKLENVNKSILQYT